MLIAGQGDHGGVVDRIALYYPYIHVRNDTWLKYAALYWPKMRRLRPTAYPVLDSPIARELKTEAGWLTDLSPPDWAALSVAPAFLDLINTHTHALRNRYGLDKVENWTSVVSAFGHSNVGVFVQGSPSEDGTRLDPPARSTPRLDPRLGYVHAEKVAPNIVDAAVDAGLAILLEARGGTWVGMHPELASVYTCALIERIATENHLHPITDQALPHAAVSGWTMDRLVQTLIEAPPADTDHAPPSRGALDAFVFMAIETVVPANLETVPVEKIIDVRSRFGTELGAFREYVATQAQRLAELEDVRDLDVFEEYLRTEVQRNVTDQLRQLREQLRSIGLESTRALVNIKSIAPPSLVAMAAHTIGLSPAVTGSATLAACVVTAPARWRRQRRAAIRESPVGYLFRIDQTLNPAGLIEQLRRAWPA